MKKKIEILLILLLLVTCTTTTTPKKYLNSVVVPPDVYTHDTIQLKKEILAFYDLKNKIWKKYPNQQRRILALRIDTLIYGKDHKFVALALFDDYNEYVTMDNPDDIPTYYGGEAFIGKKENDAIKITSILTLRTSGTTRRAARNLLRDRYLRLIPNNKGVYNINDVRFWDSKVWKEKLVEKTKEFYEMQQDSTIETYP